MSGTVRRSARPLLASLSAVLLLAVTLVQPMPAGAAVGYLSEWGGLNNPTGVATDAAGNVYVAECTGNTVKKFSATGVLDASWDVSAGGGTYGGCARDVAVDTVNKVVYVVDADFSEPYASVVKRFNLNGTVASPAQFTGSDTPGGAFKQAFGVATDGTNVYVIDAGPTSPPFSPPRLLRFNTSGVYQAPQIGSEGTADGQYSRLQGVAAEPGFVYASDLYNDHALSRWNAAGAFQLATGNGQFGAEMRGSMDVDAAGDLYVADWGDNRIQKLDPTPTPPLPQMQFLQMWGGLAPGSGPETFNGPMDVASGPSNTLYIADTGNNRIVKYGDGAPTVATGDATGVSGQAATLNGTINPQGTATSYRFEYGPTETYGSTTTDTAAGSGSADVPASAGLTGLTSGQTYHYRLVALRGGVPVATGSDRTVTTSGAPTATTGDATGVTWLVGTLHGIINPQGGPTQFQFQYGLDTSYTSTTPATPADAGAGMSDVAVTGALTGLNADRTYHYRLVALRGGVVVAAGADRTFSTWPDPGTAAGCGRVGHTIGVVGVCADTMTYQAGRWTASGNVVLNTGVAVSGDVVLNDSLQQITSTAGVTVTVQRSTPVTIGSGSLSIATGGVSDPTSNRTGLGVLSIGNPLTILLANVPIVPLVTNYLDATDGGGVIVTGRPSFDFLSIFGDATLPTGSFSIGISRTASKPFNFLGGSVKWDALKLSPLWKIGFSVGYAEGPPSLLSLMGKFEAPFLPSGTGAELSGAFSGGSLDALGIKISTPGVPLGNTGIIMDTFGGSLKGLSGGANNPLIISVLVGGGWTKTPAPEPFNWILHIKDVTLTINTAGSGSLSGELDVVDGEGRLVKGTASLTLQLSPAFLASGSFLGTFNAVAVSASLGFTAALNTSHFTAQGSVSGSMLGVPIGSGSGVLSDRGIGATTSVCIPYWTPWGGWDEACSDVGAGLTWSNVTSFPPEVDWIGSNVNQYITLTASAAATGRAAAATRRFTVRHRDPFLYVEARGQEARDFELISPQGIHYGPATKRRDTFSQTIGEVTGVAVYGPAPGTWRLRSTVTKRTRFSVQTIPALGKVMPRRILPASTATRRLSACAANVRLAWGKSGMLPADTRLQLYAATSPKAPGKLLRSGLRTTGRVTIKVGSLASGASHLYLVPQSKGIEFGVVRFPKPVWKRAPAVGQLCTTAVRPPSTRTKRLPRSVTSVRLAWRQIGTMPTGTRLLLYTARSATGAGRRLRSGLPTTGRTTVKVSSLSPGANYLYLVPRTTAGVRLARTPFPLPVWRR